MAEGPRLTRRRLLGWLGGVVGWPVWRSLGAGLAAAGCAAGVRRSEGVSGLEVKSSWRIPLGDAPDYAEKLAWAPDSKRLAVGGVANKRMSVWDVRSVRRLPQPDDQAGGVKGLAYSRDGRYLAVARGSVARGEKLYTVSVRDAQSGALIEGLIDETGEVRPFGGGSMSFSLDSRYLVAAYNYTTALYSTDGSRWRRTGALGPGAHQVAFSTDGSTVALYETGSTRRISIYQVPSMAVLRSWTNVGGPYWGYPTLAYRPSGPQVAAGHGPDLGIFDPAEGRLLSQIRPDPSDWINGLAYSPDGRILAASVGRTVRLFDSESWSLVSKLEAESRGATPEPRRLIHGIAYSPDGSMLAAAAGPEVVIWAFSS
jgi:WD40 repeat protein